MIDMLIVVKRSIVPSDDSICNFDKCKESDLNCRSNVKEHAHDVQNNNFELAQYRLMAPTTRLSKEKRLSSDAELSRLSSRSFNRLESQSSVTSLMDSLTTQISGSYDDDSLATTSLNTDNGEL